MRTRLGQIFCLVVTAAMLTGCAGRPPIADGLIYDSDWYHWDGATQRFNTALQNKYPLGSGEAVMVQSLLRQGFSYAPAATPGCIPQNEQMSMPVGRAYVPCPPYDPQHYLSWGRPRMAKWNGNDVGGLAFCREVLQVYWSAANGKITSIKGDYSGGCGGGL